MTNQAVSNKKSSTAKRKKAVCVADLDSILHRGYDRKNHRARPRGILKLRELMDTLSASHVTGGTLCQNWAFGSIAQAIWEKAGLRCRACNDNADPTVIAEAQAYAAQPDVSRIVLITNDGDYCPLVRELKSRGLKVEVWCRRSVASRELRRLAHCVRYIDHLLTTSQEPSPPRLH